MSAFDMQAATHQFIHNISKFRCLYTICSNVWRYFCKGSYNIALLLTMHFVTVQCFSLVFHTCSTIVGTAVTL